MVFLFLICAKSLGVVFLITLSDAYEARIIQLGKTVLDEAFSNGRKLTRAVRSKMSDGACRAGVGETSRDETAGDGKSGGINYRAMGFEGKAELLPGMKQR